MAYQTVTVHPKKYPMTSIMASPYNCDPTGTIDCVAGLSTLLANISNVGDVHVPKGTFKIETNLTIPIGVHLIFAAGASFVIATEVELTISGRVSCPEGQYCFTGAGSLLLGASFSASAATVSLVPGTWVVNDNVTVPAQITLAMQRGAVLQIADTKVLTINGRFECGPWQCFDDLNTDNDGVVFGIGTVKEAFVEWWGINTTPGTTDMTAEIQCAVNSGASVVTFAKSNSIYKILSPITLVSNQKIDLNNAIIRQASVATNPSTTALLFTNSVSNIQLVNGIIEGVNTTGLGTIVPATLGALLNYGGWGTEPSDITLEDIEVRYSYNIGISFLGPTSNNIKVIRCKSHHNGAMGISPGGICEFIDCESHDNQYAGLDAGSSIFAGNQLTVRGGRYYNNGGGADDYSSWSGIFMLDTQDAIIDGAYCYDNGSQGITVFSYRTESPPKNITITNCHVWGHTAIDNPYYGSRGICVYGGENISVVNNNSYANNVNYEWRTIDGVKDYIGLKNIVASGNRSADAVQIGYYISTPASLKTGDLVLGNIIWGMSFIGNVSENDLVSYSPIEVVQPGVFQSGSVICNTEALGSELLTNGGFETGSPPTGWTPTDTTLSQVVDHCTGSAGTKAMNMVLTSNGGSAVSGNVALVAGSLYKVVVWVKKISNTDSRPRIVLQAPSTTWELTSYFDAVGDQQELALNTWRQHIAYFYPVETGNYVVLLLAVNSGDEVRFDDISVKNVTSLPYSTDSTSGSFTCANNKDTTVTNTSVTNSSVIILEPTNAAAATLMAGVTSLYTSARVARTSFTVTTADANPAAGTETFRYRIIN